MNAVNRECVSVELPWPDTALWPNRSSGHHWSYKSDAASLARACGRIDTLRALNGQARFAGARALKVTYFFHAPTRRRYDLEGAFGAMKHYTDGIADALGVDDSRFEPVTLQRSAPVRGGRVVVVIQEVQA